MFKKAVLAYRAIKYRFWYFSNKSKFGKLGNGAYVKSPLVINGYENIELGDNVSIGYNTWLGALPLTNEGSCVLKFGEGCIIGNFNHIYATKSIVFGRKVLTADKVYISDNQHEYSNTQVAIMDQPIKQINEVNIGDGCWIGENVCIMGVNIGQNCVIGANAVVINDVPDYSVVVGNPAKIIKRYCFENKEWKKTLPNGDFLI